jgi:hypothetical protein
MVTPTPSPPPTRLFIVAAERSGWRCWEDGGEPPSLHATRKEAIDRAREMARAAGSGRVRVQDAAGRLEEQWTFAPR